MNSLLPWKLRPGKSDSPLWVKIQHFFTMDICTKQQPMGLKSEANVLVSAEERGVEILGIQEHRRVHTEDQIVYHRVEKCWFITSSAWQNEAQAATGGAGLLLSSRACKALLRVHYHTNRILSADFDGNPVTTVIVVYSSTNVAQAEEVEKFYEDLATAVRDIPAHNFLAILGDFNARLGPEDAPLTYHNSTNRNGEHLAAFLMEHELLAANTMFQKRMGKRSGYRYATGMQRQLDYILVRRRWRNSILNAEPYSTFNSVGSDHRVVSMRVRLSLRVPKPSLKTWYDWKARNGVSQRSRHPEIMVAREGVEEAHRGFGHEPTAENRMVLNMAKQLLFDTYDKIRGE
ncbi:craniofacial development protein 2-like [Cottoperca gobio]|uniref:Craniofacial development protein 2-like n=1 Tax=Cottoperca gobio TaxID=56716 RepID=A0A6J2S633_COTGO|nr:craniofacial development protein 2-like [Cottoperca gobio]